MQFYLAPMEGITGYIYRNAHKKYFGTVDMYMSPFISPNRNRCMNTREREDVLPGHNEGMHMVPQILTNKSEQFIQTARELKELGYSQVNLNLGCPSGTVVSKKKGAGFLDEPKLLCEFFDEVFDALEGEIGISVKTRLGMEFPEEFEDLLDIYNQYPIKELIVHPRLQKDFYNGEPDWDCFELALKRASMPICYNGDIFSAEDYKRFMKRFPQVGRIMLGRGILRNPNLIGKLVDGRKLDKTNLRKFHDALFAEYGKVLFGERNVLFKMKELWFYMIHSFASGEKYLKKIKKAQRAADYISAADTLFRECELQG